MAVGLVDQGCQGGGGKIWRRGGPGGGGGGGALGAAVAAAVVSVSVVGAVVSLTVAEDQGQPLVGSLLRSGEDDGSSQTHSMFWRHLAIIWRPF